MSMSTKIHLVAKAKRICKE